MRLILYGEDGYPIADTLAPIRSGRGLSVQAAAAEALKSLRESSWPPGRIARSAVEIEVVEEAAAGRYRYRVLGKEGGTPTGCLFECEVAAGNPILAKTIGAFCREEDTKEKARAKRTQGGEDSRTSGNLRSDYRRSAASA